MSYVPSKAVREAQEKLAAIQKRIYELGNAILNGATEELSRLVGTSDVPTAVEKLRELNREAEAAGKQYEDLRLIDESTQRAKDVKRLPLPGAGVSQPPRGIGDIFVQSKAFRDFRATRGPAGSFEEGYSLAEMKANFLTTTGWPPESTRIPGLVIEYPVRPIQLLDLLPTGTTDQAAVLWIAETTRTHAAAERAEAGAYAESTFELTPQTAPVRSIGDSIPVSDEQLEDVAAVQSYLNNRLTFGVRQRLDGQVLNGDGTAPNLLGILNVTGIQTRAKGATEPAFDAIGKAIKDVQVTGRAFPNVIVMHPTDWWNIRLTRAEGSGIYILGNPGDNVEPRLFGLRVALSDAFPSAGTALVADLNHCQLFERRGLEIEVGYVGNQFTSGMRTIRASLRVAFAVYRPAAFCTVTEL